VEDKPYVRAQGYRVPKVEVKDLILSIVTLGFKRPGHTEEEAKTYSYTFEDEGVQISEVDLEGNTKTVTFKSFSSVDERNSVLSKGKFQEGAYIYYLDKETIS